MSLVISLISVDKSIQSFYRNIQLLFRFFMVQVRVDSPHIIRVKHVFHYAEVYYS